MKIVASCLNNGLPVIYIENKVSKLVNVNFKINVGAKNEKANTSGLSHLVEHAVFLGCDKYSLQDIENISADCGTNIDAGVDTDFTTFSFRVVKDYLPQMMDILGNMLQYPNFEPSSIKKEVEVIKTEMKDREDEFDDVWTQQILISAFNCSIHQSKVFGPEKTLNNFTRDNLIDFWKKYYTAPNSVMIICGDCDNYFELAERYFGKMSCEKPSMIKKGVFSHKSYACNWPTFINSFCFIFGNLSSLCDNDVVPSLLCNVLSARLFNTLRNELALLYKVEVYCNYYYCGSVLCFNADCSEENTHKVILSICEEIVRIRTLGISEQEFIRAKNKLHTEYLSEIEDTGKLIDNYAEDFLLGRLTPIDNKLEMLQQISISDVNILASNLFNNKPVCGVIGDEKQKLEYEQIINYLKL